LGSPHPARDTTPLLDRVSRLVQEVGLGAPRDASAVGTTALTLAAAAAACGALAVLGAPLVVPVAEAASTAGSLAIGVGFVIGVRHAFEPDHLVAVATLVSRERGTAAAMRQGASWGLGHAVSLLALGSVLSVAQRSMPAALGAALEFGVGAMLVTMGVRALRDARRVGGTGPVQRHRHGLASHAHSTAGEHVHVAGFALARRPLAVGVVHGLAGSGAVTALVTSTLPTFPEQLLFVLFFGFGSTIGMAAMAGLAGWPLARFVRTAAAGAALSAATGAGAVVLGVLWVYPWARTLLTL
jgi:hypothetical protein